MPVFDAHAHLDAMAQRAGQQPSAPFVAGVMREAREVGVARVITVGDTVASSRWCVAAAREHPDVYAAVGGHPPKGDGINSTSCAEIERLGRETHIVAVG
ncbi:MAG: TatD family hydrolase, partial [Jatrophihabitantaceae bacterium]